jgi:hypothetical protein
MKRPLTNVLLKVFAFGFYQVHAPILLVVFFILVGCVPGNMLISYHQSLMMAMCSSPVMLAVVGRLVVIHCSKAGILFLCSCCAPKNQFLFYSSNALERNQQLKSWGYTQAVTILAPGYYLCHHGSRSGRCASLLPVAGGNNFLFGGHLVWASALIYTRVVNRLIDGSSQSLFLKLSSKWRKPYFSLYIYHVFR